MILNTFEKKITAERILSRLPGDSADLYEDDVDDLLEQIDEADAMYPGAAWSAVTLEQAERDSIGAGGFQMKSSVFDGVCKAGDIVYPCLLTVGNELDAFAKTLDDPMLSYLQGVVMNLCLDDALLAVAAKVAAEHPGKKLMMVKPGIEGICEFSEQQAILSWLDGAEDTLKVTVSEHGFLTPGYSSTALLFVTEGECNFCSDWQDDVQRSALLKDLNKTAGHI